MRAHLLNDPVIKQMHGKSLTGEMLAEMAICYSKADIPNIQDTWTNICQNLCLGALDEADKHLKEFLAKVQPFPHEDEGALSSYLQREGVKVFDYFIKRCEGVDPGEAFK